MFSTSIFNPIIGRWIDSNRATGTTNGLVGDALELFTGQETLSTMVTFPAILVVCFAILYFVMRGKGSTGMAAH